MAMALSRSRFGTSIGVMTSHAGAASAPLPPRQKAVASSTAGVAQCMVTTAAKTIDIAVTAICAPISIRRASMMSVSAPAGRVRRNIGSVVATWTADTIIGSGLRLVMSQFDEVSNIAKPTFDAELAISMTVNARLPKTPQRQSPAAGASDLALDSLDNKIPLEEREIGRLRPPDLSVKWRTSAQSFKAPQCERRPSTDGCGCSKMRAAAKFARMESAGRHLIASAQTVQCTPLGHGLGERAATNSTNFASVWHVSEQNPISLVESEQPSLACYGVRK